MHTSYGDRGHQEHRDAKLGECENSGLHGGRGLSNVILSKNVGVPWQ